MTSRQTGDPCEGLQFNNLSKMIELAAVRTAALGIEHIAEPSMIASGCWPAAGAPRCSVSRQCMRRFEWSHKLLTVPERVVLRRLAVFPGMFDLEAAAMVAASPGLAQSEVIDLLSNLVSKSLVDRNAAGYRLLETMRAFAFEKLVESGEREAVSRRHAEYHLSFLERAEIEWRTRSASEWLAELRAQNR